jgi:tRNA pseudouridine38-40 synthase
LNFHLSRQQSNWERDENGLLNHKRKRQKKVGVDPSSSYTFLGKDSWTRYSACNELRILNAVVAPDCMNNDYADVDKYQPSVIDWNARFSATSRTYIYRVLCYPNHGDDDLLRDDEEYGMPFEWDRAWKIRGLLSVDDMREASKHFIGQHDFTTFRGARCQRKSPIINMKSIQVHSQPYGISQLLGVGLTSGFVDEMSLHCRHNHPQPQLVTICITANSFLYRQVRNMVGCLVEVGSQNKKLKPNDIPDLLCAKQRSLAPNMAPPHGLFLADVQHGDFVF